MLHIADNLKYLRNKRNLSQTEAAEAMQLHRDRYRKYEDGSNTPPAEILVAISRFYHVSIDLLLTVELRKVPPEQLLQLENNRILFPITVDPKGDNLIEVVLQKAKAGYLGGYSDPEYIESLPQVSVPFLGSGKYRGFPVEGDSMPPLGDGSIVVGEYMESLSGLKRGNTYILVTVNEGIVYKRLQQLQGDLLWVESDNDFYPPYTVPAEEVLEIWEYRFHIGRTHRKEDKLPDSFHAMWMDLRQEIGKLRK